MILSKELDARGNEGYSVLCDSILPVIDKILFEKKEFIPCILTTSRPNQKCFPKIEEIIGKVNCIYSRHN